VLAVFVTLSIKGTQHIMAGSVPDLRVLVVADDPLARAGLATLLAGSPGSLVVSRIAGDADVLAALDVYRPDVVVWDLGWDPGHALASPQHVPRPEQEGPKTPLERLADLREAGVAVVALLPDSTYTGAAWTAGARGLLLREASAETLAASLQAVVQGLVVCDATLAATLLPARRLEPVPPVDTLTPRETEVLRLVAEGLPNKTIADRLHISEHTVKFHLNAIMGKLGAQSRTEAVVRATRLGLLLL
jgi:two-component system nitrate/nitrite response regulator NarL